LDLYSFILVLASIAGLNSGSELILDAKETEGAIIIGNRFSAIELGIGGVSSMASLNLSARFESIIGN